MGSRHISVMVILFKDRLITPPFILEVRSLSFDREGYCFSFSSCLVERVFSDHWRFNCMTCTDIVICGRTDIESDKQLCRNIKRLNYSLRVYSDNRKHQILLFKDRELCVV